MLILECRWLGDLGNHRNDRNGEHCLDKNKLLQMADGISCLGTIRRENGPMLSEEQWSALLEASGFNGLDGAVQDYPEHPEQASSVMFATARHQLPTNPQLDIIIVGSGIRGSLAQMEIESSLKALGSVVWIDFLALLEMDLTGKHCILLDEPTHQYLTTMTAASFRGL